MIQNGVKNVLCGHIMEKLIRQELVYLYWQQ